MTIATGIGRKVNKNKFRHYLRIKLDEQLEKSDIVGLVTTLRKTIPNIFNPISEGAVVIYGTDAEKHVYDFKMARNVTEAEAEIVIELIEEWTDSDYVVEITTSESYVLPDDGEQEHDITAMKHNRWVQEQVNKGWRYGLEFNESEKTSPKLRPYHELTDKIKSM